MTHPLNAYNHLVYTFYLGLVDKNGVPVNTPAVYRRIHQYLKDERIDGYTLQPGVGIWKGQSEPVTIFTIVNPPLEFEPDVFATFVEQIASQEKVLWTCVNAVSNI